MTDTPQFPTGQEVTAVILAGGMGTRLRAAVADRPKVLAPVAGRPFITYLLDKIASTPIEHVVLCTGYRAEMIEEALGTRYGKLALSYSREIEPLGTGGALRLAVQQIATPLAMVFNGDSYCDADLMHYHAWFKQRAAQAALLLTDVDDVHRFGCVTCDAERYVVAFCEKGSNTLRGSINAGIYLLERKLLDEIPTDRAISLEYDVFPRWAQRRILVAFAQGGRFLDIGTPETFAAAETFFARPD